MHCHSKTRSGFQIPNPVGTIPYFLFITPVRPILDRWNFTRPGLSSFAKIAPTGFLSCASRHTFTFLHAAVTTLTMLNQLQRCAGYTLPHSTFPELALFRIFACIQYQIPVGLFASLGDTDRYYMQFDLLMAHLKFLVVKNTWIWNKKHIIQWKNRKNWVV